MFKASSESIFRSSKRVAGDSSSGAIFLFVAIMRMTLWATVSSLMRAHHNAARAYFDSEFVMLEFMICGRQATSLQPESFGSLRCDDAAFAVQHIRVN